MAEKVKYRGCEGGTMHVHRRLLNSDPNYARRLSRIEEHAFRSARSVSTVRAGCTRIPVVVHVIHKAAAQNISQVQVESQIAILNRDFRKKNSDISNVPAAFASLAGDARVEFKLATVDPDGNPTDGITRTATSANSFDSSDRMKFTASDGHDAWPSEDYLNIWVCQLGGGLLGYAQFPGGPSNTDGVVCTHTGFGDTGTATAPFDKGRTTTHEIGHWLNLRHIWGDDGTGCSGSDFVSDTPNQGGSNISKPTFPSISCGNGPNGDMFMNYMDYVDDDTMVMFSQGQITRMQACLDGPRSSIGESISCDPGGNTPKIPPKDLPKDLAKDSPKDFGKDLPKDNPKDFSKDLPKDNPKDFSKDFPKDNPKEFSKEFPKDNPKELSKELPKDLPFDTGPPQKTFLEPPFDPGPVKGFMEPPVEFPTHPIQPVVNPGINPGVPFVLGTGAAPGANPAGGLGSNNAEILVAYQQILQQYSSLGQRGMLDAQGQASWQQVWDSYQQMGGR